MANGQFTWGSLLIRLVGALALVYATYNPDGYSYFHWAMRWLSGSLGASFKGAEALLFLTGILLMIGWVVFLNATRQSLGSLGVLLTIAFCAGLIWLFVKLELISVFGSRTLSHLVLIVIGVVLALGMSWSHIRRQLTGQVTTDEVD